MKNTSKKYENQSLNNYPSEKTLLGNQNDFNYIVYSPQISYLHAYIQV